MGNRILVGVFVGLTFASTSYFLKSNYFSKEQKIALIILIIFPPGQWLLGLIFWFYNSNFSKIITYQIDSENKSIKNLTILKEKGIINENEYSEKINSISKRIQENFIINSEEYKILSELWKKGILTETEFNEKVKLIEKKLRDKQNILKEKEESENIIKRDYLSVNNFKTKLFEIEIPENLKSSLSLDSKTLSYTLENIDRYIKLYNSYDYPFYCALLLDKRGVQLNKKQIENLELTLNKHFNQQGLEEKFKQLKK